MLQSLALTDERDDSFGIKFLSVPFIVFDSEEKKIGVKKYVNNRYVKLMDVS